jgi:hypothetical protein
VLVVGWIFFIIFLRTKKRSFHIGFQFNLWNGFLFYLFQQPAGKIAVYAIEKSIKMQKKTQQQR